VVELGVVIILDPAVDIAQRLEGLHVSGLVKLFVCECDGESAGGKICVQ
jgi:hypothetical protein